MVGFAAWVEISRDSVMASRSPRRSHETERRPHAMAAQQWKGDFIVGKRMRGRDD
jgi:hypothetical protein